jgi:hypothetical protein
MIMIRERWPSLFEKVPLADFILSKIDDSREDTSIDKQINKYNLGKGHKRKQMTPYELSSKHFPQKPPNDKIHISS